MSSKTIIKSKKDYILVEIQEIAFWEIFEALERVLEMPEYPNKDVIWVFEKGPLNISYEELYKIGDLVKNNYPQNVKADKKCALVVETGLHTALAKEYVKIVKELPPEFRVFSDLSSAENWISSR